LVTALVVFLVAVFDVSGDENGFHVRIQEDKKVLLKKIVRKVSGVVYREATEHNPEGDMLPDEIDDMIKGEIKERF